MTYRVHRIAVDENTAQEKLEQFLNLNQMEGELTTVVPYPVPKFQGMGAAIYNTLVLQTQLPHHRDLSPSHKS
jgi:hypothetical protein